jgi:hypothetical protein
MLKICSPIVQHKQNSFVRFLKKILKNFSPCLSKAFSVNEKTQAQSSIL